MPLSGGKAYRWQSRDGLELFCRIYDDAPSPALSVLCLHGLTRNSRDFELLAPHLAPRFRIICPDLRGRGLSARDPDWRNYNPGTYVSDVAGLLTDLGIDRVAVIGTSLGGIIAMTLAAMVPDSMAGIILNDIGPEIDPAGAARIRQYAGQLPPVHGWPEAIAQAREVYSSAWPNLTESTWAALARRAYREDANGVPTLDADPLIGEAMRATPDAVPDLWQIYGALARIPTLAIRGALSDILGEATFARMKREKPDLRQLLLADRGHVPLLDEPLCVAAIDEFLEAVEQAERS